MIAVEQPRNRPEPDVPSWRRKDVDGHDSMAGVLGAATGDRERLLISPLDDGRAVNPTWQGAVGAGLGRIPAEQPLYPGETYDTAAVDPALVNTTLPRGF